MEDKPPISSGVVARAMAPLQEDRSWHPTEKSAKNRRARKTCAKPKLGERRLPPLRPYSTVQHRRVLYAPRSPAVQGSCGRIPMLHGIAAALGLVDGASAPENSISPVAAPPFPSSVPSTWRGEAEGERAVARFNFPCIGRDCEARNKQHKKGTLCQPFRDATFVVPNKRWQRMCIDCADTSIMEQQAALAGEPITATTPPPHRATHCRHSSQFTRVTRRGSRLALSTCATCCARYVSAAQRKLTRQAKRRWWLKRSRRTRRMRTTKRR